MKQAQRILRSISTIAERIAHSSTAKLPDHAPLRRHRVVTTFNREGYELYGHRFLETFLEFWPRNITCLVYAEKTEIDYQHPRITVLNPDHCLPRLQRFKSAYISNPFANGCCPHDTNKTGFQWQAVRFSNKVFATTDAVERCKGHYDHLIWLDADSITHRTIPHHFLDRIAPAQDQLAAYLNRRKWPECGWVGYNLNHPAIDRFTRRFEDTYLTGEFLQLKESHDSFVFWKIVEKMRRREKVRFKYLGSRHARGHIFINSALGAYLDHLKGDRKLHGRSFTNDLWTSRPEDWWLDKAKTSCAQETEPSEGVQPPVQQHPDL